MNWTLLGIEATKDKAAITAAYRARVVAVNPEDKPEEFKALRAAYEEALALAAQEEAPRDESPLGRWKEALRALYDDFARRIDPVCWRALLQEDVCQALDSRPQAEEALLRFLMEDFYLPRCVWQVLDEAFHWSARAGELCEHYPRDFVEYAVLDGIRMSESLPFALFTPGRSGAACDQYRRLYYQGNNQSGEELAATLAEREKLPERHPYGELQRCRLLREQGRGEEAAALCEALYTAHSQDGMLTMAWASECIRQGRHSQAEALCCAVLEQGNERYIPDARRLQVQCLVALERFDEAKKVLFALVDAAGGDQKQIHYLTREITELNQTIIARREQTLSEHPEDYDNALQLGWCYLQNDRNDQAVALYGTLQPQNHTPYDYHHFSARIFQLQEQYEPALQHLQALEAVLRALPEDCQGEDKKHLARLPEFLQLQGACHFAMGQREAALEKYEEGLRMNGDDGEMLTRTAHFYFALREYGKATQVLQHLTEVMPHSYHGHFLLAQNLYQLGRDQEAFQSVNRALELDGSDLGVYVLKMRILLRNGVWEEVEKILDFLAQNNITDETSVLWCRAQLLELGQKKAEEALSLYQTIAQRLEQGEHLSWGAQVYLRITAITAQHKDARESADREELMAILDKGLAIDGEDYGCLDYKAWLLKRHEKWEEALAIYHKLEQRPHSGDVERELAELYYKDLNRTADKALHYYELLLSREETVVDLFYAGVCCRYLRLWDKGEQYFRRLKELDGDDIDGPGGLGLLYEWAGRTEEALAETQQAIDMVLRRGEKPKKAYYLRAVRQLRRLGRPEEAVTVLELLRDQYDDKDWVTDIFDTLCQFGLWARAEEHLKAWKRSGLKKSGLVAAEIKLKLYRGDLRGAKIHFALKKLQLSGTDRETMQELLAMVEGHTAEARAIWECRVERDDNTHALMNLAQRYAWEGAEYTARLYAARCLEKLDKLIPDRVSMEALYRSRRAMVLAILGRETEAREELAAVRRLPLCENCDYGACKDADIYEAAIEELFGSAEEALRLSREGLRRWPDELDFAAAICRLEGAR